MVRITITYAASRGASFDHEYYETTHMELARRLLQPFGLERLESSRAIRRHAAADGDIVAMASAYFPDFESATRALDHAGHELLADLPNYTTLSPTVTFASVTSHLN